jgi:hypothetical protein
VSIAKWLRQGKWGEGRVQPQRTLAGTLQIGKLPCKYSLEAIWKPMYLQIWETISKYCVHFYCDKYTQQKICYFSNFECAVQKRSKYTDISVQPSTPPVSRAFPPPLTKTLYPLLSSLPLVPANRHSIFCLCGIPCSSSAVYVEQCSLCPFCLAYIS